MGGQLLAPCFDPVCTSHPACVGSHLSLFHLRPFEVVGHFSFVLIVSVMDFLEIRKMKPGPIKHDSQKCIVPGCHSSRRVKHEVFPKDEVQGRLRVEAVSNPHLNDLTY